MGLLEQKIYLKILKIKALLKNLFFLNLNIEMFEKQIDYVLSSRKNKFDKNLTYQNANTLRLINKLKKKLNKVKIFIFIRRRLQEIKNKDLIVKK